MKDKELLEGAARAMGLTGEVEEFWTGHSGNPDAKPFFAMYTEAGTFFNPLNDDGDALRLAVKLGISITPYPIYAEDGRHSVHTKQRRHTDTLRQANPTECIELYRDDAMAATRLAIVRCAFEISKGMR